MIAAPVRRDPTIEPMPVACGNCNAVFRSTWFVHEASDRSFWVPAPNPCKPCQGWLQREADELDLIRRQARAGIPKPLRGYRWSRTASIVPNEQPNDFQQRVRGAPEPTIGVWRQNYEAVGVLADWRPKTEGSIWLQGDPGSGKTLMAVATATAILERTGRNLPQPGMPHDEIRSLRWGEGGGLSVLFIDERELHDRARLSWKGDMAALYRVSKARLLILDDLGTTGRGSDSKLRPVAGPVRDSIEKLLCYRADRRLPTLITSNEPIENTKVLYGARVYSRLMDWCRPVVLGGADWRLSWTG